MIININKIKIRISNNNKMNKNKIIKKKFNKKNQKITKSKILVIKNYLNLIIS